MKALKNCIKKIFLQTRSVQKDSHNKKRFSRIKVIQKDSHEKRFSHMVTNKDKCVEIKTLDRWVEGDTLSSIVN